MSNTRRIKFTCPKCRRPVAQMIGDAVVVNERLEWVEEALRTEVVCGCGQRSRVDHLMQTVSPL